ncbi:hypothetical protein NBRC116592_26290 [Colwellia sp. KU-HH00111]|mgnify:CR=1 FL=1
MFFDGSDLYKDVVITQLILKISILLLFGLMCLKSHSLQVIAHQSVKLKSLSSSQLRRIYSVRQIRWPNNEAIMVFVLPSQHPVHKTFSKDMLHIFPYQLDSIWNKLTFSGLGVAPKIVNSQAELIHAVSTTRGSIGYVEILNKENQHVNVINITK